jgi:NAD(P)-dependent dehydrogenase (short-subunit alcohol dehydrogenase family)
MGRLAGKNAVVIGAGSGAGRATSLLFAREGAAVACVENDTAMGEETAALIRTEGGDAIFIECDLAHSAAIEGMARSCMAWRDTLHVLFNNTVLTEPAEFEDISLEDWNRQIAVNLTAPFLCSQKLLPALKAAGGAAIIHHGSIDGVLGNPTLTAYSAAKGGLKPLTHVMGHWLAGHDIRVNCINTGLLRSGEDGIPARGTTLSRNPADEQRKIQATPLARAGRFEEAAEAALFLATEESSYINGSIITLDGGRTGLTPGTF